LWCCGAVSNVEIVGFWAGAGHMASNSELVEMAKVSGWTIEVLLLF
jgi:hypothetical protein